LDPCVYEVFQLESALELNPEVVTLTPGTPGIDLQPGGQVRYRQINKYIHGWVDGRMDGSIDRWIDRRKDR